jgi:hypothetical protein
MPRTPAALVSAAVAFFLLAYPGGDFGQREQIAVLFVLPYVLTSCLAVSGRSPGLRTSLISGVLGGIGFAIKPHFLLAFVLAELVVLAHRLAASGRWLRPSAAAAALTMLVYAVVVIVFVPQFLEVARDVVRVYGGLDEEPHVILALVDLRVWAAAAFAFAALHRWLPHRPVSLLLLAVATGFLGAAVVQMKGWPYHLYPWRFFIAVFAASVSVSVLERLTHSGRLPARTVPILAAAASLVLVVAAQRAAPRTTRPSGIEQVVALDEIIRTARAESVAVLSMRTILFPAFPGQLLGSPLGDAASLDVVPARALCRPDGGRSGRDSWPGNRPDGPARVALLRRDRLGPLCRTAPLAGDRAAASKDGRQSAIDRPARVLPSGPGVRTDGRCLPFPQPVRSL